MQAVEGRESWSSKEQLAYALFAGSEGVLNSGSIFGEQVSWDDKACNTGGKEGFNLGKGESKKQLQLLRFTTNYNTNMFRLIRSPVLEQFATYPHKKKGETQ